MKLKMLFYYIIGMVRMFSNRMFRKKTGSRYNVPIHLARFAQSLTKTHISSFMQNMENCYWFEVDHTIPSSFHDMCFCYKNQTFSVLVDILNEQGRSYLDKTMKQKQLRYAKEYNLVPCLFPIVFNNPNSVKDLKAKFKNSGLNLVHTKTGKEIDIDSFDTNEKIRMSNWELLHFATRYVMRYLEANDKRVIEYQADVKDEPNILFNDERDNKCWLIINEIKGTNYKKDEKDIEIIKNRYPRSDGYIIDVSVESVNQNDKNLYRNTNLKIKYEKMEQIYSSKPEVELVGGNILEENPMDIILNSTAQDMITESARVCIFPIPKYDDYLFKIGKILIKSLKQMPEIAIVPIKYDDKVKNNPRFGLPLYYIVRKQSKNVKRGYVLPEEISAPMIGYLQAFIVKKISGQELSANYKKSYAALIDPRILGYKQYDILQNIYSKYGTEAAEMALEFCKNGINKIEKGQLAKKSKEYRFYNEKIFYENYKNFSKAFLENLQKISELPQRAYDNAVADILMSGDFMFDFKSSNIFVDFEKQEFHFIDLIFDKAEMKDQKFDLKKQLSIFREVIMGEHYAEKLHHNNILFYKDEIEQFKEYMEKITQKINNAAPEGYKITEEIKWK